MKKLLMVMVLGASAVAASAQGLQPRRTSGGHLQRQKMLAKAAQRQETVDGFTWSYRVSNGEATIMKLEKGHESCAVSPTPKGHFTIPSTLGGAKVTGIGGYAFSFCGEMTSVTLPDAVKEIGWSAFLACGLTSVKIPEGVTSIGNQAFYGCGKLTSVTIPASVESIGWGVFGWCPQLKQVNLADGNQRFTVVDGVLYTKDLSELIMCPNTLTSVKIPSKVSKIGMMSFEGCEGLVSQTIPEGVTNIGEQAFRGCRELASVTMLGERPASLNNIFDRCGKLKAIHVPAKCKSWAGMKKWCGISLVFDGKRLNQQKKVCEEKANVNSGTSKRGVKELTFGADDGLPCELTMVELPGDEKVAAFAIGKYEITQEQYEKVMGTNPSKVKGAKLPVNNVTYDEAKKFCERLNGLIKRQDLKWTLPDEKQWQYAAKGGEKFKFAGSDDINEVAWTMENSGGKVQPVGGKKPNGFGLYDMCGNVCEWGHFVGRSFGVVFAGPSVHVDTVKERKIRVGGRRRSGHIMDKGFRIVAVNKSNGKSKQTSVTNAVAEKLQGCKFLVNEQVKGNAKFYLCLFSASWCGPCRREMPRIAKTYAETLKDDPDIELIHFSRDQNDEKALAWAKEHDVKFPVVKPKGGNPLDLHSRGIPHLFIVKADGTLVEEGHPMRIFNEEKFRELKKGDLAVCAKPHNGGTSANTATGEHTETVEGYTWAFKVKNGEATIISEKGRGCSCAVTPKPRGNLTIPSSLGGARVTSIGRNAFFNCHELTSVTIPKGVTSIGGSAFGQCGGLTSVTIPSSVTNLDGYSFYYCSKLKSVTIPSNVTSIGSGAFNNCRGLLEFVVEDGNPAYRSLDGVLYDKELTSLIQYPCDKTGTLTIPSSVTSIGHGALFGCRRQEAIDVEEGNRAYCSVDGILYDKNRTALIRCPVGKCGTVTIPCGVTRIGGGGSWAFRECRGVTSVIIPSSVTSIESMSFLGCDKLTSVEIPASVERIGNEAFMSCSGLKAIDVEDGNGVYRSVDGILYNKGLTNLIQCPGGKTGEVTVPSSVTSIEGCAFYNCRGLTSVTMRGERPDIPRGSFGGSRGVFSASRELTAIHVPANAKSWAGMKKWQGKPLVFDAESKK